MTRMMPRKNEIDEIINSAKAYKSELEREAYKNNYGYEETARSEKKTELPQQILRD